MRHVRFFKNLELALLLFFFALYSPTKALGAKDSSEEKSYHDKIEAVLKKSKIPKSELGIYIAQGFEDKEAIYQLNENKMMIPASVTKLITAAATLQAFPPGTKIKTQLLSPGNITDGTLRGDLYLKGAGDPSFVSESMWFLVNHFLRSGIKKVEGQILVDDSLFDKMRFDESRQKVRVDRAYDAPTGAMSFNWNSVNIFVRPAAKAGEKAQVFADPENDYIRLTAKVTTVAAGKSTDIDIDRKKENSFAGDHIIVSGQIAVDAKEFVAYKNITQPDVWSGHNLKSFLSQRGIQVTGSVGTATTPASAKLLAEYESKPIEHILADMNKFSNNYVAEMLVKLISSQTESPATLKTGLQGLSKVMTTLNISNKDYEIYNPSGLTRNNRITAQALWKVVHYMRDQFQYQPEYVTSLPIAGIDGTMKKRLKGTKGERWVRAKTGFLTDVVSLAGYLGRPDGDIIPFVMMFNGKSDENSVRALYDQILLALLE